MDFRSKQRFLRNNAIIKNITLCVRTDSWMSILVVNVLTGMSYVRSSPGTAVSICGVDYRSGVSRVELSLIFVIGDRLR